MNANELRIGNYVFDGKDVETVNSRMISMLEKREADFASIPLTEEWLTRFGFEDKEYTMELNGLTFSWGSRVISTGVRSSWSCDQHPHIRYVHQLQNIYFALTGQELKLNP